jgi:hypothetical protein
MDEQKILDELLALLESHGVTVRSEALGGAGGGLCSVKGASIFFLDTEASSAEAAACCAEAVGRLLDTATVYIRPEVRRFIEDQTGSVS